MAVEPDRSNAILARRNLDLNAIKSEVLEAAIGPDEGTVGFEFSQVSNPERISEKGLPVTMMTVDVILEKSVCPKFALVKIDIEVENNNCLTVPSAGSLGFPVLGDITDYGRLTS
jgi:FkbM family methyltransferase